MKISSIRKPKKKGYDFISAVGADTSAVPIFVFYPLIFVALGLPNLIYSGISWFDTLHIMKWAWTMLPFAAIALVCGVSLFIYGNRTNFKIDAFAVWWLLFIAYVSTQPLWADIFAKSTYLKEWFFLVTLFGAYVFFYNFFTSELALRVVLWLSIVNGILNTIFAELLIRSLNSPFWFIMNVPENYIGNTGQQEMFGLWLAIATFNSVFLYVWYAHLAKKEKKFKLCRNVSMVTMALCAWGLINSTTRAGYIALICGFLFLALIVWNCKERAWMKQIGISALVIVSVFVVNVIASNFGYGRFFEFFKKIDDQPFATFGGRSEIWATSMNVVKIHPVGGVGLGHFKWHYLEAQKQTFKEHPNYKWQFTYWAHSEYIQWLAEFGVIGIIMLAAAAVWWLYNFIRALLAKKDLSYFGMYGCAFVAMIWFDAVFSRPFHRIENVIWLSMAFAFTNREFLSEKFSSVIRHSSLLRLVGVAMAVVAFVGAGFLYSGCVADKYMRAATLTRSAKLQRYNLNEALKSKMGHDEAQERMAYHYIAFANATRNPDDLRVAVNALEQVFRMRPTAQLFIDLLNLSQRAGNRKIYEELLTYLKADQIRGKAAPSAAPVSK